MARMMVLKAAVVLRFLGKVAMGCWAWSGTMLLGCVLLYWVYGGFFALLLLCIAMAGTSTTINLLKNKSDVSIVSTGIIYHAEDQLLYHPEQPSHSRVFVPVPSMFGLPYENLFIRSLDGTLLHMFFVRQPPPKSLTAPTLIFFHGNAGNMGHR